MDLHIHKRLRGAVHRNLPLPDYIYERGTRNSFTIRY
jgi:hypothetical protein